MLGTRQGVDFNFGGKGEGGGGAPTPQNFFFNFHFFATYDEKIAFWDPKIFGGQGPRPPKF